MVCSLRVLEGAVDGCLNGRVDGVPFLKQLGEDLLAVRGEAIEPLIALFLFAPLAGQQSLGFQAPQQRVERAFVDDQAVVGQGLAQRVAVTLLAKLRQDCERQASAAEFEPKVLEQVFCESHAVPHTLYINYCITYSV